VLQQRAPTLPDVLEEGIEPGHVLASSEVPFRTSSPIRKIIENTFTSHGTTLMRELPMLYYSAISTRTDCAASKGAE
jgi:hypothetical protein